MRRGRLLLCLPALLFVGAASPDPVGDLAGRYSSHFRNGLVDGSEYWSDNVVEIVPVDPRHAYIRFSLQFYNGHSCSLAGVAAAQGDALVYREPAGVATEGREPCRLTVRHDHDSLAWSDADGTCKSFCGMRGSFLHDGLAWSSKRPIRYLGRLRRSREYQAAMTDWRAHP